MGASIRNLKLMFPLYHRKPATSEQPPPIIITIRQVIKLPRDSSQETAVQTSLSSKDGGHFAGESPCSVPQCPPGIPPANNSSDAVPTTSQAVQADTSPYLANTAAQTDPCLTDLATQTDFSDFTEQFLSFGTQTAVAGTITQGCQTQPDAHSCEFGTQTTSSASESTCDLVAALSMASVDFGTQTAAPPTITGSGTSTAAAVDCDFMMEHLLPPGCMDFGTQTLESSLVDVLPCLDLGMQTLLETRDQGSQTL